MKPSLRNKGTSLIELLIYIALLSVAVVFTSSTFTSLLRGRGQSESASEVNSAIRFGMEEMVRDIKGASVVTTPATAGTSANTLVLTLSGNTITYSLANGTLERQVNASTPEPLNASSTLVTSLFVTRVENTNAVATLAPTTVSIRISLAAKYNSSAPEWQYSTSATTTATLR